MRKKFLIFGKPVIGNEEINEVMDTLKSGWWGTGPKTRQFEKDFAKYVSSHYALGVNSCTSGIHLALKALNIGSGDEVITTPLTFCSTANVIIHAGATPIFADIDPISWNIDPEQIEKSITSKTKAIIPVHLHGRPADMRKIHAIAKKHRIKVIEDAAHAIEAIDRGRKIGSISDVTVFSFYVTKNLATAEGGMVTTNSKRLIDRMRVMSLHGLSKDAYNRYRDTSFTLYECVYPGFKYNMTDLQASLGIHQLKKINSNHSVRKKLWKQYDTYFDGKKEFSKPAPTPESSIHGMHLYAIVIHTEYLTISRNQFVQELLNMNIGAGVHFHPVHLHKYYRTNFGYKRGMYPQAEFIGDRIISLPLTAGMKPSDVTDVINAIENILSRFRKP